MEEEGLVEREIPKDDRRATYARIAPKGTETLLRAKPVHLEAVEAMFSRHIGDEQAAVLRAACMQVLEGNRIACGELLDPE